MHLTVDDAAAVLGVDRDATSDQIRSAYKSLALRFHPDKNNQPDATQQFQKISLAYKKLSGARSRRFEATSHGSHCHSNSNSNNNNNRRWSFGAGFGHQAQQEEDEDEEEEDEDDEEAHYDFDDDLDDDDEVDLAEMMAMLQFVLSIDDLTMADDCEWVQDSLAASHLTAAWMANELCDLMDLHSSEDDDEDDDEDEDEDDDDDEEEEEEEDFMKRNPWFRQVSSALWPQQQQQQDEPEWIDEEEYSSTEEEPDESVAVSPPIQQQREVQDDQKENVDASLPLNSRVCLFGKLFGTVRFIGPVHYTSGVFVGIELDEPIGKNNGNVKGVQYFKCLADHGLMVRRQDDLRVIA